MAPWVVDREEGKLGAFEFEEYFDQEKLGRLLNVIKGRDVKMATSRLLGGHCRIKSWSSDERGRDEVGRRKSLRKYWRKFGIGFKKISSGVEKKGKEGEGEFMEKVKEQCVDESFCGREKINKELGGVVYERTGEGFSVRRSEALREVMMHLRPSKSIRTVVAHMVETLEGDFNAVDVGKGKYRKKCHEMEKECKQFGRNAFTPNIKSIVSRIKGLKKNDLPVLLITDDENNVKDELLRNGINNKVWTFNDFDFPLQHGTFVRRQVAQDLITWFLASRSQEFVGNRFSYSTNFIQNQRLVRRISNSLEYFQ